MAEKTTSSSWADVTDDIEEQQQQQKTTKPTGNAWGRGNPLTGGPAVPATTPSNADHAFPALGESTDRPKDSRPSEGRGDRSERSYDRSYDRPSNRLPQHPREAEDRPQYESRRPYDNQRSYDRGHDNQRGYENRGHEERRYENRSHGGGFEERRGYDNPRHEERREGRGWNQAPESRPPRERTEREPVPFPTEPPYTAFVGNLSFEVTEGEVQQLFEGLEVVQIRLMSSRGAPKGYGYVEFKAAEDLTRALQLNDTLVGERPVRIDIAQAKDRSSTRPDRSFDRPASSWREGPAVERGAAPVESKERVKLELKPRSVEKPSEEVSAVYKGAANPFGGALPRELVLRQRPEEPKPAEPTTSPVKPVDRPPRDPKAPREPRDDRKPAHRVGRGRGERPADRSEKTDLSWERGASKPQRAARPPRERRERTEERVPKAAEVTPAAPVATKNLFEALSLDE